MTRAFLRDELRRARQSVHAALRAEADGQGTTEDIEGAMAVEEAAAQRARPKGWRPARGHPSGFVGGECARCGQDVVMREELAPLPYPNGFRPPGLCFACRGGSEPDA